MLVVLYDQFSVVIGQFDVFQEIFSFRFVFSVIFSSCFLTAVNGGFVYRVMKTKLKVSRGMHLGLYLRLVVEIKLYGFGKYFQAMSSSVLQCCKDIHKT